MTNNGHFSSHILKRENIFIFFVLLFLIVFSWSYIFYINKSMAQDPMQQMEEMAYPQMTPFGLKDFFSIFIMWSFMMIAMMLPSAIPMILVFAAFYKKKAIEGKQFVPTWMFLSGYISIWVLFSLIAAILQVLFHNFALISSRLKLINPYVGGSLLIAAGIYQLTPLKSSCLKNCQTPLNFIMENWRYGKKGALIMGFKHGFYCVGCCWVLMLLLFAAGVMNILWIALIALFIFTEKIIAKGRWINYISGIALILFGLGMIM